MRRSSLFHLLAGFLLGGVACRLSLSIFAGDSTGAATFADFPHLPTLTFSRIFVLSLPSRLDRRREMRKLGEALNLELEVVDATGRDQGFVRWLGEEVDEVRKRKLRLMADAQQLPPSEVRDLALARSLRPDEPVAFPSLGEEDFLSVLEEHQRAGTLSSLSPISRPTLASPQDPEVDAVLSSLPSEVERLSTVATWFSHTELWRRVVGQEMESVLILEDDVDAEWEVGRIWRQVERKLPEGWDIVYLGDCGGREGNNPAYLHPYLHRSTSPVCLHSYALSLSSAAKLLSLLHSSPWTAYSSPIDLQLAYLISSNLGGISAFSLDPPLIIQREDDEYSDIRTKDEARKWTGVLADSTAQRIAKKEGRKLRRKEWQEAEFYAFFYGEKREAR